MGCGVGCVFERGQLQPAIAGVMGSFSVRWLGLRRVFEPLSWTAWFSGQAMVALHS